VFDFFFFYFFFDFGKHFSSTTTAPESTVVAFNDCICIKNTPMWKQ